MGGGSELLVAVAVRTANTSSNGWGVNEHTAYTLDSTQGQAVAVSLRGEAVVGVTLHGSDGTVSTASYTNCCHSLRARNPSQVENSTCTAVQHGSRVRRLMPIECERLQGFADGHTLVPYRGKPASDGPRYKAIGNSKAVPVVRWVGRRLLDER